MTKKEQAALKRVAKKLSAMRATLNKPERVWLDRLILGDEVVLHAATVKNKAAVTAANRASEVALHAATVKNKAAVTAANRASEVALHAATVKNKAAVTAANRASEVALHAATVKNKRAVTAANAASAAALLEFDATTGGYRLNDNAAVI